VKDSQKEAKKMGAKVEKKTERAAKQVSKKADEATDTDVGAKVEKTAEKAGSKLKDSSNNVQVNGGPPRLSLSSWCRHFHGVVPRQNLSNLKICGSGTGCAHFKCEEILIHWGSSIRLGVGRQLSPSRHWCDDFG